MADNLPRLDYRVSLSYDLQDFLKREATKILWAMLHAQIKLTKLLKKKLTGGVTV